MTRIIAPILMLTVALAWAAAPSAQQNPFLGRWNITGTGADSNVVYWLEVKDEGGKLSGMFLNRGGSPVALAVVKIENGELVFQMPVGRNNQPVAEHRARVQGDKLAGKTTPPSTAANARVVEWVGVRPPKWPAADANAAHKWGKPVELFNGKDVSNWDVQNKSRGIGWSVADGVMTNDSPGGNNLVSKDKFQDFKINAEYKLEKGSNSGIYLRGRYELQVLDDMNSTSDGKHSHMALYAWVAPKVQASKPPGEWQTMEATIVGNKLTVILNGQKVHDNTTIEAITGGALDANESEPGPIMIQGDHEKVWFRKVTVTPIVR
jgi:hypothetical protein